MDNEMVVMRASGMNQYELARAALILSGSVTVVLLFMTTWISPKCAAEMQGLRQTIQMQYSSFLLREGVFNTFGSDLTVYLRSRSKSGDLQGLMIHDNRDKDAPPITITAKKGRIVMEGGIPNIIVYDGMRQQIDSEGGTTSRLYFSRYTLEIKGLEDTAPERWREANERSFWELLHPDLTNKRDRSQQELFFVEANNRLITPLNAFGFTLTALAAVLLGPFNRRGQNKKVLLGAALVVTIQLLNIALVNLAKKHPEMLPLLYLNTLIPVAGGLYLLHIRGERRLMTFLRRWNKLSGSPA
jgi:lipopolysaccharide export system permease protein